LRPRDQVGTVQDSYKPSGLAARDRKGGDSVWCTTVSKVRNRASIGTHTAVRSASDICRRRQPSRRRHYPRPCPAGTPSILISLCNLCVLCVSVVCLARNSSTT